MPTKLTDSFLRGMAPDTEERDALVEGLVARKRAATLSFVFAYQHRGQRKKLTLGQYPGLSLANARTLAQAHRGALQAGRAPHVATAAADTFSDLLDAYSLHLDETAKDPGQVKALLDKHVRPALGSFKLTAMTRRDLQALVDRTKPVSVAAAVGRYVKAAWRYGVSRDLVEHDIASLLDLPAHGTPRQRILSDAEVKALLADWLPRGMDAPARSSMCAVMALCLLTGARRSEIAELTWGEIQGDVIHLSAERSKGGRPSLIVLSSFAQRILAAHPRFHDTMVFPAERIRSVRGKGDRPGRAGRGAVSGFGRAVADCYRRTGTEGWTVHDLRRTASSGLARAGVAPHVIEAMLNHSVPALQRTYQVHHPTEEIRAALEAWGEEVSG